MNRVCLIGRLTKDAEMKATSKGVSVSNFNLAVNDWGGGEASFFYCVLWNSETRQQYLTKGTKVAIDGYLKQERWETKEGTKASRITIVVQNLELLSGKGENQQDISFENAESDNDDLKDVPF